MMQNYVKRFSGGAEHMYPAARAYRKIVHDHHLAIVREKSDVCYWFDTYHSLLWYRSGFNPEIKCDYVMNNIAEFFNNWIKDIKEFPMYELADKIREKIMKLFHGRRRIACRLEGKILSVVLHVLKARTRDLDHLSLAKGDNYYVEV
jgi:hypothetical protein